MAIVVVVVVMISVVVVVVKVHNVILVQKMCMFVCV